MNFHKIRLFDQTDEAIREIREGGEATLKAIYREYRKEFLSWAKRNYNLPESDSIDVFQDAVIIFYNNVKKGKIKTLESSIKTYLFGICKNLLLKNNEKKNRFVLVENASNMLLQKIDWNLYHDLQLSPAKEKLSETLDQLSEKCLKIIHMVYYLRFSMEAVKERMGYKSEEVARSSKRKCMKTLKEAFMHIPTNK